MISSPAPLLWRSASLALMFFCLCTTYGFAQDGNTLLWRIEGKDVPSSSYLYGTMHARDQRVYDFADSVDIAFHSCTGFAMEVTLDSIVAALLERDIMPSYYNDYTDRIGLFAPLVAYHTADTLPPLIPTTQNTLLFLHLQSITRKDLALSNDNPTIVDAYLYRLARQQNKVVTSLESVSELQELVASAYEINLDDSDLIHDEREEGEEQETNEEITTEEESEEEQSLQDKRPSLFSSHRWNGDSLALDSMATLYREGNLEQMEAFVMANIRSSRLYDILITKRNHNMKAALMPLIHQRPTFIAVGAGHLPGEQGLIELLRAEGYTVSPVPVTRTQAKTAVAETPSTASWHAYSSPQGGYTAAFPEQPVAIPLGMFRNTAAEYNTVVYPDISSGITYITTYTDMLRQASEQEITAFINAHVQHWLHSSDAILLCTEPIRNGAMNGQKICVRLPDENYYAMQIVAAQKRLYLALAIAPSDTLYPEEIHRFFSSFQPKLLPVEQPSLYTSTQGAFSVRFPAQWHQQPPIYSQRGSGIQCSDAATGIHYRAGYIQEGTPAYYQNSPIQTFAVYSLRAYSTTTDTTFSTYPASIFVLRDSIHTVKAQVIARGSRKYYLLADIPHGTAIAASDGVFASFRFLDYAPTTFSTLAVDSLFYAVDIPAQTADRSDVLAHAPLRTQRIATRMLGTDGLKSTLHTQQYLDHNTGLRYNVQIDNFGSYYYSPAIDSVFALSINPLYYYRERGDTLYSSTRFSINGFPACSYSWRNTTTRTANKGVVALRGDTLYHISVVVPISDTALASVQQFLSSLHLHSGASTPTIFTPKSEQLLRDIASTTRSVRRKAHHALSGYAFTHSDIPRIYEALQHPYTDDTVSYASRSTRGILLQHLKTLHDSTTVPFLTVLYTNTQDAPPIQVAIVQTLAWLNTQESVAALSRLLQEHLPATEETPYNLFAALEENPQHVPMLLPALRALFERDQWLSSVYSLLATALDSAVLTRSAIATWHLNLVQNFRDHYTQFSQQPESGGEFANEDYSNRYKLQEQLKQETRLLQEFGNPDTVISILQALAQHENTYLAIEACIALLRNNRQPANAVLDTIARDAYARIQLYRRMQSSATAEHFPQSYNTQEALAESLVTEYLSDYEDTYPYSCTLVATRDIPDGPQAGRYFFFTFSYAEQEDATQREELYGILCGPQPLDAAQFSWKEAPVYLGENVFVENKSAEYLDDLLSQAASADDRWR